MPSVKSHASSAAYITDNPGNMTITMPSGIVAGDLLLLWIVDRQWESYTVSGFTPLLSGGGQVLFYKVAVGGDTATATATGANASWHRAVCLCIEDWSGDVGDLSIGADGITTQPASYTFYTDGTAFPRASPAATAVADGSLVLRAFCSTSDASANPVSVPSGTTLVVANNPGGSYPIVVVAQDTSPSSGAVGAKDWTGGWQAIFSRNFTVAIAPNATIPTVTSNTITGTAKIGQTLTCVSSADDETATPAYQWYVAENNTGTGETALGTASTQALNCNSAVGALIDSQNNAFVRVDVTYTNGAGSSAPDASDYVEVTLPGATGGTFYRPRITQL